MKPINLEGTPPSANEIESEEVLLKAKLTRIEKRKSWVNVSMVLALILVIAGLFWAEKNGMIREIHLYSGLLITVVSGFLAITASINLAVFIFVAGALTILIGPPGEFNGTFKEVILFLLSILLGVVSAVLSQKLLSKWIDDPFEKTNDSLINLQRLTPLTDLYKFKEISKIYPKNSNIKQYVQTALAQRDFLINAEYSAIKSCDDTRQGQLRKEERDKKEQRIYAALKGETS